MDKYFQWTLLTNNNGNRSNKNNHNNILKSQVEKQNVVKSCQLEIYNYWPTQSPSHKVPLHPLRRKPIIILMAQPQSILSSPHNPDIRPLDCCAVVSLDKWYSQEI